MAIAAVELQAGYVGGRLHRVARPLEEDELNNPRELPDVLPEVELWELVSADDPVELVVRIKGPEVPRRVDRETHAAPRKLEIRHLEAGVPFGGRLDHREPILGRGLGVVRFHGRLGRRHDDQPVQPVLLKGVLGGEKVAEVDGIETPSEKSDFHVKNGDPAWSRPPGQGQIPPYRRSEVSQKTNISNAPTMMTGAIMAQGKVRR